MQFKEYYIQLQKLNGITNPIEFVGAWRDEDRSAIISAFSLTKLSSLFNCKIVNLLTTKDDKKRTNQSMGNVVAEFFQKKFNEMVEEFQIIDLSGAGYPDKLLINKASQIKFCFEIKATTNWNKSDSIRRVLTASSDKIRKAVRSNILPDPPNHIICTLMYEDECCKITEVRMDFLEPDTEISVRYEAATSQKLLSCGTHKKHNLSLPK